VTSHRPYTLIAELTYRCPLRCPYCSNPLDYASRKDELTTAEWARVLGEAEKLGVVQAHLTGGEPLVRGDLEEVVRAAREVDLYVSLITSGVPLTRERLRGLREAGLDCVQLSVQDADKASADRIAGRPAHAAKLKAAAWVREEGLGLTINVVLHRSNIDNIEAIIAMAEAMDAHRLELANTQFHGFAFMNRAELMPTQEQLSRARAVALEAKKRLTGRMDVVFVLPDYYAGRPRACMDGWGRRFLHLTPFGLVLPCHAAHTISGLHFETIRERPLAAIWEDSPALQRFRGEDWMPEPCRSCPDRAVDFGGCRCQAFHVTGDAAATDPACSLSPLHGLIAGARLSGHRSAREPRFLYRSPRPA
jgi:PqqA peptide cyclase